MTTKQKIRWVTKVVAAYKELEKRFIAAEALFGCDPETPFQKTMYETLLGGYIAAVSELIGDSRSHGSDWLGWYIWDNSCGKNALEASWTENGKTVKVKVRTPADLVRVIEGIAG